MSTISHDNLVRRCQTSNRLSSNFGELKNKSVYYIVGTLIHIILYAINVEKKNTITGKCLKNNIKIIVLRLIIICTENN